MLGGGNIKEWRASSQKGHTVKVSVVGVSFASYFQLGVIGMVTYPWKEAVMEEPEGTNTNSKYVMVQGVREGERGRLEGGPCVTGASSGERFHTTFGEVRSQFWLSELWRVFLASSELRAGYCWTSHWLPRQPRTAKLRWCRRWQPWATRWHECVFPGSSRK